MTLSFYDATLYFIIYSFAGWILDAAFAKIRNKKFINRGFLNGPFRPMYGFTSLAILVFLEPLMNNVFMLFIASTILVSLIEYLTGYVLERIFHEKWWDYSDKKYNLNGQICLQFSVAFGLLGTLLILVFNPASQILLPLIPTNVGTIIILILLFIILVDFIITVATLLDLHGPFKNIEILNKNFSFIRKTLNKNIYNRLARIRKAAADGLAGLGTTAEAVKNPFAQGINFHKLVWIFMIGSFIGVVGESLFFWLSYGITENRSGVIYGPFNPTYGFAIIVMTICLYGLKDKRDLWVFLGSMIIGSFFEYCCSLFQELSFGTVSWNYSNSFLSFGGRTDLLHSFIWGLAGVVWIKELYPLLSGLIEKIPRKIGAPLTYIFFVFMVLNMLISSAAVYRQSQRHAGVPPANALITWFDNTYNDVMLKQIYPGMIPISILKPPN